MTSLQTATSAASYFESNYLDMGSLQVVPSDAPKPTRAEAVAAAGRVVALRPGVWSVTSSDGVRKYAVLAITYGVKGGGSYTRLECACGQFVYRCQRPRASCYHCQSVAVATGLSFHNTTAR